jgi:L-threonylcarbamoyladenylate synthase
MTNASVPVNALATRHAARVIRAGGVVAYPTEGVWGLGCDPLEVEAFSRILAAKERPLSMGVILLAGDRRQLDPWVEPPDADLEAKLGQTWPGPVTWILRARPWVPSWITGGRDTLAARVTAHPAAAALSREAGTPIVSTSANRSGHRPARNAVQVRRWLGGDVDFILGGATGGLAGPTPILDGSTGDALRSA